MKRGIVFEGGASRTFYSCGVQDVMMEAGIPMDYIIGVSAGITYGLDYAANQPGRNIQVAKKYMKDKRYMGFSHMLDPKNRSYYNIKFAFETVANELIPFDIDSFAKFPGEVIAVVTNIHTGKAEYLPVSRTDKHYRTLVASCALPILFQPIEINHHYYIDGGISDSIPFEKAIADGCDKLVVILTRERGYLKQTDRISRLSAAAYKKYPNIREDILCRAERYNENVKKLYQLEKTGKVFIIAPEKSLGVKRTERDPKVIEEIYQIGRQDAKNKLDELKKYLELS